MKTARQADRPRAVVLSFTKIAQEPRAVRQANALAAAGWDVTLAGYASDNPIPAGCSFVPIAPVGPMPALLRPVGLVALLANIVWTRAAESYYWLRPDHRAAERALSSVHASLIVCNDHYTFPLGARLAQRWRARLIADCHEYALGEYPDRRFWKLLMMPYVDAIQRHVLPRADAVTTVSAGIARQLAQDYGLAAVPAVVRNVPVHKSPAVFRPCGERIEVLYHGLIVPMRELEPLIEAFRLVRPEFHLVVRGPGEADYIARLGGLCTRLGLGERVRIEPPVALDALIGAATASDVGIFLYRDRSPQMRFVLPNKLFEYVMAGLAVCVSDLAEMAAVVEAHDLGTLVPEVTPEAIAAAINALDRATIDRYKQRALAAARELNWESEQKIFLRACGLEAVPCAA